MLVPTGTNGLPSGATICVPDTWNWPPAEGGGGPVRRGRRRRGRGAGARARLGRRGALRRRPRSRGVVVTLATARRQDGHAQSRDHEDRGGARSSHGVQPSRVVAATKASGGLRPPRRAPPHRRGRRADRPCSRHARAHDTPVLTTRPCSRHGRANDTLVTVVTETARPPAGWWRPTRPRWQPGRRPRRRATTRSARPPSARQTS